MSAGNTRMARSPLSVASALVTFTLLAGGALQADVAFAEDSPRCKQLLAESQRLRDEAMAALAAGPDAEKLPRSKQIQQRMEQIQRESRKDGESLNTRDPKAIEAFQKRDAARTAELLKLAEEQRKVQAPVVEQKLAGAAPAAERSKQAYAAFEKECRQRERQEEAEQRAECAKHRKVDSDYYQKKDRLNEQIKDKRKPYETAQAQLDAYRKGGYKEAFDAVDAAYSGGRQPTPTQLTALSNAEKQLKSLQQDADTKKRQSEQETAPLLAQMEKDHQAQTDYDAKTPLACK